MLDRKLRKYEQIPLPGCKRMLIAFYAMIAYQCQRLADAEFSSGRQIAALDVYFKPHNDEIRRNRITQMFTAITSKVINTHPYGPVIYNSFPAYDATRHRDKFSLRNFDNMQWASVYSYTIGDSVALDAFTIAYGRFFVRLSLWARRQSFPRASETKQLALSLEESTVADRETMQGHIAL